MSSSTCCDGFCFGLYCVCSVFLYWGFWLFLGGLRQEAIQSLHAVAPLFSAECLLPGEHLFTLVETHVHDFFCGLHVLLHQLSIWLQAGLVGLDLFGASLVAAEGGNSSTGSSSNLW